MSIFSIFLIAVGLSMDAFAVSLARAMTIKKQDLLRYALILGFAFGFFQGFMPFIGWWAGSYFQEFIVSIDHWIAFILLALIGGNMIKEAFQNEDDEEDEKSSLTLKTILILSIATSIDAFAVGISFAFLQVNILTAILLIGITTFVICFMGVFIGNRLGDLLGKYAEILGGGILILIGLKILIEHLFG
ncbi:manganese efflux pump MntP family protein [Erysipelotrichaceae bacterium HCN-30851]